MTLPTFTPSRREALKIAAGAAAGTLLGAGSPLAAPRRGGTLNLLVDPEPPTLLTIAHTAFNSLLVSAKVTEGLLSYDFNLNPKPQLATAWSVSPDGLEYSFTLRRGVKWHDGRDFASADVAYSILTLREVHPRGRATFAAVTEVRTPDPHVAVIVLSKPTPYLLTAFAAAESPIVPRHIYEGSKADQNPANNAPVGTGPYVFKEWVRGSHILYERNPNYWDQPKPYLDRLVVRFIPDLAAKTAAIEAGEIQLAPQTPVALSEIDRIKALPHLAFTSNGYQYINTVERLEFNLERKPFQDLRVRQAFAHAIDRKVVLNTVWYGYGKLTPGPVSPSLTKFYYADLPGYAFDPAKAEKLLDEAGYARGADGIRLRLTHDFMPGQGGRRAAEYFKQALAKVGIDVTVRAQDFATYVRRVYTERDFDFNYGSMSNSFDPTVGIQRLYWSKSFKRGLPFSNGSGYSNPDADRLLEAAAVEIDPARRYQQFAELQRIVVRDLPDITLIAPEVFTVADRRLADHTVSAEGVVGNLADAYFTA